METARKIAVEDENINKYLEGKTIVK